MSKENLITLLYHGKIHPAATIKPSSQTYRDTLAAYDDLLKNFTENLKKSSDSTLLNQFLTLSNHLNVLTGMEMESTFVSGFQSGAKIILEIIKETP